MAMTGRLRIGCAIRYSLSKADILLAGLLVASVFVGLGAGEKRSSTR